MKLADLTIDLNDLWGRVVPGSLIILDLFLVMQVIEPVDATELLSHLTSSALLSTVFLLGALMSSHILGELSLYTIFRVRRFLRRPTPRTILDRMDVTMKRELVSFYESSFAREALEASDSHLLEYCKTYLLQHCEAAYSQARRIEARINLKGGIIIPLIGLAVTAVLVREWGLVVLSLVLVLVFGDGFRRSFEPEFRFVLVAYYNCYSPREERGDEAAADAT